MAGVIFLMMGISLNVANQYHFMCELLPVVLIQGLTPQLT